MIKKSMDILDIYAISNKYDMLLRNCFIDNIYYVDNYWLFKLRCTMSKYFLKIEPSVRIHLSRTEPPNKSIDNFTAFLRKYVRSKRIESVKQLGWERIVVLEITSKDKKYNLITEIIPRGFLVFVDGEYKILYANRYGELRDRVIKRGLKYTPPPGFSSFDNYIGSLRDRLRAGKDLVRGIVKGWGLPGYIAEEIIFRAGLYEYKNAKIDEISSYDIDRLIDTYKLLISEVEKYHGYLIEYSGDIQLYTAYRPRIYEELYDATVKEYEYLDDVIDLYFTKYEKTRALEKEREKIDSMIKSLEKTIESQKRLINEYEEKHRLYQRLYELLTKNYARVEEALDCARRIREAKGWNEIPRICSDVSKVEKHKGLIYIVIGDQEIPIDIRLDTWKNIIKYKKLAGDYRSSAEKAVEHLNDLLKKLEELKNKTSIVAEMVSKSLKPRYWFEKYHWMITSNGFLVIGGRNADQNESLVRRHLEPHDIFLHADIHGAPATILKTQGKRPSDKDIEEASVIAGCYSRAWREGFGYVDVFWVKGVQVSKKAPAGEYLTKGAFMIYGKKNYLRVKLELAIGIEEVCDPIYGAYQRVIIGPPKLVESKSIVYGILVPGDTSPKKIARELYEEFKKTLEVEKLGIGERDILDRIPGSSELIRVSKGSRERVIEC